MYLIYILTYDHTYIHICIHCSSGRNEKLKINKFQIICVENKINLDDQVHIHTHTYSYIRIIVVHIRTLRIKYSYGIKIKICKISVYIHRYTSM